MGGGACGACGAAGCSELCTDLLGRSLVAAARQLPRRLHARTCMAWSHGLYRHAQRRGKHSLVAARRLLRGMLAADSLLDESRRPEFDTMLDFARLSLEFGYVLMFTVVWPLAPLASLGISLLEQRCSCVRLAVATRRPPGPRCSGLGTGDAWFAVFSFLAGVSTLVNCGMIALSTTQLDDFFNFDEPLPPFEKLLIAVGAEHLLLLAKLALQFSFPDSPDLLQADARRVEREFKTKYKWRVEASAAGGGGGGGGGGAAAAAGGATTTGGATPAAPPAGAPAVRLALSAVYPSSGPMGGGTSVSVRGACLGQAVSRGEIQLALLLPRAARPVLLDAAFVSDAKLAVTLPPSPHAGVARLSLPDASADAGVVEFRYYAPTSVSRLRPAEGPTQGGTAVRVSGAGFVQTGEACICVRMRGVEQRVPAAFISESEVRFMLPDAHEAGEARVQLSLNGQQYEGSELGFQYYDRLQCAIA